MQVRNDVENTVSYFVCRVSMLWRNGIGLGSYRIAFIILYGPDHIGLLLNKKVLNDRRRRQTSVIIV